jgi:Skp family chaperone for outer membrane proteins
MHLRGSACLIAAAVVTAVTLAFSGMSSAADLKLGKIQLNEIFTKSKRIREAVKEVKQMQQDAQAKMMDLQLRARAIESKLGDKTSTFDQATQDKLKLQLAEKQEELQALQQNLSYRIAFKKGNIQKQFEKELNMIVSKIAKERGLTMVMSDQGIVYSDKSVVDLTKVVLSALDAMAPAKKDTPAKPGPTGKPGGPQKPAQKPAEKPASGKIEKKQQPTEKK